MVDVRTSTSSEGGVIVIVWTWHIFHRFTYWVFGFSCALKLQEVDLDGGSRCVEVGFDVSYLSFCFVNDTRWTTASHEIPTKTTGRLWLKPLKQWTKACFHCLKLIFSGICQVTRRWTNTLFNPWQLVTLKNLFWCCLAEVGPSRHSLTDVKNITGLTI